MLKLIFTIGFEKWNRTPTEIRDKKEEEKEKEGGAGVFTFTKISLSPSSSSQPLIPSTVKETPYAFWPPLLLPFSVSFLFLVEVWFCHFKKASFNGLRRYSTSGRQTQSKVLNFFNLIASIFFIFFYIHILFWFTHALWRCKGMIYELLNLIRTRV